jgi:hypothetical protein
MYTEGVTRAFPVVRTLDGEKLADGDFTQVARGDRVETRMVFRFLDGSLFDETVVFAQHKTFTLLSYRIVQRGPSFPETIEASIDRETERYNVRYRADEDSPEEAFTGKFSLPDDVYSGMLSLIVKNLPLGSQAMVQIVAFTPKPRLVKMQLMPVGEDSVVMGNSPMQAIRYAIRPHLGLFASVFVTDIPDIRCWVLPGDAPAFVKAEGPLYFMGPVWRIQPH